MAGQSEDIYDFFAKQFDPVKTAMLKAAPPMAPFGQEKPSIGEGLAQGIMDAEQGKRKEDLKSNEFAAGLAEKVALQKDTLRMKAQIEADRMETARNKLANAARTDPVILQRMRYLTSLTNIYSRTDQLEMRPQDVDSLKKQIDTLGQVLAPYTGISKDETINMVPTVWSTLGMGKEGKDITVDWKPAEADRLLGRYEKGKAGGGGEKLTEKQQELLGHAGQKTKDGKVITEQMIRSSDAWQRAANE